MELTPKQSIVQLQIESSDHCYSSRLQNVTFISISTPTTWTMDKHCSLIINGNHKNMTFQPVPKHLCTSPSIWSQLKQSKKQYHPLFYMSFKYYRDPHQALKNNVKLLRLTYLLLKPLYVNKQLRTMYQTLPTKPRPLLLSLKTMEKLPTSISIIVPLIKHMLSNHYPIMASRSDLHHSSTICTTLTWTSESVLFNDTPLTLGKVTLYTPNDSYLIANLPIPCFFYPVLFPGICTTPWSAPGAPRYPAVPPWEIRCLLCIVREW